MSSNFEGTIKSYISTADIAAYVLVKKSGSNVVVLDSPATDLAIGITTNMAKAGYPVTVRSLTGGGTAFIKVDGPVAQNAAVRQLAGGVVDDTGSTPIIGYAEEAATAQNDVIEIRLGGTPGTVLDSPVASASQAAVSAPTAYAAVTNMTASVTKAEGEAVSAALATLRGEVASLTTLVLALRSALITQAVIKGSA